MSDYPTCSITACVSNLIELRISTRPVGHSAAQQTIQLEHQQPTFQILQNFPKPVWFAGRAVRDRERERERERGRDPAGPSRSLVKAWPGGPGLARPRLVPACVRCSTERELPSRATARRFRILLCSSLRCTGHLQQAGPHCQFTHDKPFRVKSWPYWSSWVVSSWLSRTRSIVLLPDGLAVTSTATATEDQLQFFSADNRETSQSSPSVQTLSYCRTRWQWSRWSNIVAGLVNFEDKPSTPWKVSQASNGGEIISISKSHHITNIEYV